MQLTRNALIIGYNLKTVKAGLLMVLFSLAYFASNAQGIKPIQNNFNTYQQNTLQEKIFVHTDKSTYLPGEIAWFKVYCVDGNDHKPLNLSKVAYVDIIDNNQVPVVQAKVALSRGSGHGSLYIPVTVSNGNYRLRAYTSWMKNFSPEFYFQKIITLINPLRSPVAAPKGSLPGDDVQFFPEGGHFMSGAEGKVGFKAVDAYGKGVSVTGIVINDHKDTVIKFKTLKFGMGSFLFTPAASSGYKAIINTSDGKQVVKDLPTATSQGYAMHLTDDGSGQLNLAVTGNTPAETLYLLIHTRQIVKIALEGITGNKTARFKFNKSDLGDGISHITVFNSNRQPVCERLYFKRPQQRLQITATAGQQQYDIRKKVDVDISSKDLAGAGIDADMSMAVYKVDSLQEVDPANIFNSLWLSSDLKGNIESPGYYFENTGAESDEAADNLMLTQGWSRFDWANVIQNKLPVFSFLPEYSGHIINARIVNTITGKPAKNIVTYLGVPGKRVQLYTSASDSAGNIRYYTKDFFGQNELVVQTNNQVDSTCRIDIANPFSEQYLKIPLPGFNFNNQSKAALKEHSLGIQVLNIYSGSNIRRFYDPVVDSSAFYGKPYKTYKLDDYTRFPTMEEDLREYVMEENVTKQKGGFHIKTASGNGFLDGDPLLLVDGIPEFNTDKVIAMDPLKVRKIEVIRSRYFYGPAEHDGIFSFTTYKGDLGGLELDPHALVIDYEGLQLQRAFYSPAYETNAQQASRLPDFRNLLYWSPNVKSGNNAVSFYTSDQKGKFVGVVQGITANGDAGYRYFTFEVK